jgi:hypothetical protein
VRQQTEGASAVLLVGGDRTSVGWRRPHFSWLAERKALGRNRQTASIRNKAVGTKRCFGFGHLSPARCVLPMSGRKSKRETDVLLRQLAKKPCIFLVRFSAFLVSRQDRKKQEGEFENFRNTQHTETVGKI